MTPFLSGFADELVKVAVRRPTAQQVSMARQVANMTPSQAKHFLRNAAALGIIDKLMNPDVGIAEAAATGGALEGGFRAGHYGARKVGLKGPGRLVASLGGSILGSHALRAFTEKPRKERARETLYGDNR